MSGALTVVHLDTERGWRGGERQVLWLARELARQGHASIVGARPGEPLARAAADAGLRVLPLSPRSELSPLAAAALRRTIVKERVDVVHAHTGHSVTLGAVAVMGTSARLVLTRRVDFELRRHIGTRWKYGRAHGVIAISKAVAEVMVRGGVDARSIDVIPDGVDLGRSIAPARPETLAAMGLSPDRPLVVMVAALVPHKDPLNFVRAVAHARTLVPRLQAVLAGDGFLRAEVERATAEHQLGDTLVVAGYRTDADALIAAADVFVLSSEEEGMGSVLLDALSCGIPVAATRAGGIPEVIQHDRNGLLAPIHDPRALGEAIARLLLDESLARRIGEAARKRAADFSIERTAERTLDVYRRVLAERRPK